MDIQRLILLGALGLVLMMIWQSWIEFQSEYAGGVGQGGNTISATSDVPQTSNLTEDVPDAPLITQEATDGVQSIEDDVVSNTDDTALIDVKTDLVKLQIDPEGGDIVRVELVKHPVSVDMPDEPFVLMSRNNVDLFVAQSGLIGSDREYPNHNTSYTTEAFSYEMGGDDQLIVPLRWRGVDGIEYLKEFRFSRGSYRIDVSYTIVNNSSSPWNGFFYGQLKQTERETPGSQGFLGRLPSYNGAAVYTAENKYDKVDYDEISDEALNASTSDGWVAMLQHYFVAAWLPQGSAAYQLYTGVSRNTPKPQYRVGYKSTVPVVIEPGQTGQIDAGLFVGPKNQKQLDAQNVEGLKLTVDYGWLTIVADPLFWLLNKIQEVVKNWGWSIILLTVLIKLIFLPLSAASYKSMAKMKKLQPRLQTLKDRYGDDKQKFQQEMMKLYKTEKVNPAGGCLPILIQIPVFIALYWVLLESVELRQANFIGWLNDLSSPDPYFILPLLMGASMLAQQLLNPAPMDPLQKKIMTALPVVFTVFFLWFPAGLVLYWVANNLLSIAQQYYITKKYQNE
ncbi:MAG: membrane protein insertase YidC [Pseudomonadota bacterium]